MGITRDTMCNLQTCRRIFFYLVFLFFWYRILGVFPWLLYPIWSSAPFFFSVSWYSCYYIFTAVDLFHYLASMLSSFGVFLWTVFLLNPSLALDCTASWVIIDCIIPWLIINSCQHTSANSNQLSWWLHFSLLYSFILLRHMRSPSWHHDCFSCSHTSRDMTYVALIVWSTYCVWYSCCFDHTVQFHGICSFTIFFIIAKHKKTTIFSCYFHFSWIFSRLFFIRIFSG